MQKDGSNRDAQSLLQRALSRAVPSDGDVLTFEAATGYWKPAAPSSGSGSVTTVSVVSTNGFAGTVANATTTPAITLTTTISGLLKGNGTAMSAAVSGTDYVAPGTTISTTAPLSGGGNLSTNRTITTSMSTNKLIGRSTAGTGVMEEITIGTGLSLSAGTLSTTGGGTGDVVGPSSSVDNAIVRFDGTTGKLIQDYSSNAPTITDSGAPTFLGRLTLGDSSGTVDPYILYKDTTDKYGEFIFKADGTSNWSVGATPNSYNAGGFTGNNFYVYQYKNGAGTNVNKYQLVVKDDGKIQFNSAYTFPTADGSADTFLKTNGSGALSFATPSVAGSALTGTSLAAGIVTSSLTAVGTIATGTWSATTIAVDKGGTGQTSYTNGQLLIGNTTGNTLTKATLTAGTGITVTNGGGSITIAGLGYVIVGGADQFNPADGGVYYVGAYPARAADTTAAVKRVYIPVAGTLDIAYVEFWNSGTLGTTETSTIAVRLNNTTDTTISSSVKNDAATTVFSNTSLGITVAAGDYVELKWTCPTWSTNPTNVRIAFTLYIR